MPFSRLFSRGLMVLAFLSLAEPVLALHPAAEPLGILAAAGCTLDEGSLARAAASGSEASVLADAAAFARVRGLTVTGEDGVERLHPAFCPGAEATLPDRLSVAAALDGCVVVLSDLREAAPLLGYAERDILPLIRQRWMDGYLRPDPTARALIVAAGACTPEAWALRRSVADLARAALTGIGCGMTLSDLTEAVATQTGVTLGAERLLRRALETPEERSRFVRIEGQEVVLYDESCNAGSRDAALPRSDLMPRFLALLGETGCVLRRSELPDYQHGLGLGDADFAELFDLATLTGVLAGGPFRYEASLLCQPAGPLLRRPPNPGAEALVIAPSARARLLQLFRAAGCSMTQREMERAASATGLRFSASEAEGALETMIERGEMREAFRRLTLDPGLCAAVSSPQEALIEAFVDNDCLLNPAEVQRAFGDAAGQAAVGALVGSGALTFPGGMMALDRGLCKG